MPSVQYWSTSPCYMLLQKAIVIELLGVHIFLHVKTIV